MNLRTGEALGANCEESGMNDRDPGLLANFVGRNHARICLEDRIPGAERKDLEPAVGAMLLAAEVLASEICWILQRF
jgi:hypothetical protein